MKKKIKHNYLFRHYVESLMQQGWGPRRAYKQAGWLIEPYPPG